MDSGRACAPHQIAGEHDPYRQGALSKERHGSACPGRCGLVLGCADGHRPAPADPPYAARTVLTRRVARLLHDLAGRLPAVDLLWRRRREPGAGHPEQRGPAGGRRAGHGGAPAPPAVSGQPVATARPLASRRCDVTAVLWWFWSARPPARSSPPSAGP